MSSEEIRRQLLATARTVMLEVQHYALTAASDQSVFAIIDDFLTRMRETLDTLPEPDREAALFEVMREMLQADAWLVRGREGSHFVSQGQPPRRVAVFLYGVNIPGGRRLNREELRSVLTPLPPGVEFEGPVGDVDNLLFSIAASSEMSEEDLRLWLTHKLRLALVTIPIEDLSKIVAEAKRTRSTGATDGAPLPVQSRWSYVGDRLGPDIGRNAGDSGR